MRLVVVRHGRGDDGRPQVREITGARRFALAAGVLIGLALLAAIFGVLLLVGFTLAAVALSVLAAAAVGAVGLRLLWSGRRD
jgi:hypothetical protein